MASVATLAPITLTDRAVVEVKNIIQEKNVPADYGLRIGVRGGIAQAGEADDGSAQQAQRGTGNRKWHGVLSGASGDMWQY